MRLSDREIETALCSAARVVDRYGEVYWPLFERLERELIERRARASRLGAYLDPTSPLSVTTKNPFGKRMNNLQEFTASEF